MQIPDPKAGLVINYSYLWQREAAKGQEEGRKDRPCAVILAMHGKNVAVAPITHTPPQTGAEAIEIPPQIKKQLGLDEQRSWLVTNEVNRFEWPGMDLRPTKRGSDSAEYGQLPPAFLKQVQQEIGGNARRNSLKQINRDEEIERRPTTAELAKKRQQEKRDHANSRNRKR